MVLISTRTEPGCMYEYEDDRGGQSIINLACTRSVVAICTPGVVVSRRFAVAVCSGKNSAEKQIHRHR